MVLDGKLSPPIKQFTGEYFFLSNFYPRAFPLMGLRAPTAEHHYQRAKTEDPVWKARILSASTPKQAKALGREAPQRPDWKNIKVDVMRAVIRAKFIESFMVGKLLATGNAYLIEGNYWKDTFWGQCPVGTGHNWLGILLMERRTCLAQVRGPSGA